MTTPRITPRQAAIISAYTGVLAGPFCNLHRYAEEKLGRPIWTHEFADKALSDELKEASTADFLAICAQQETVEQH